MSVFFLLHLDSGTPRLKRSLDLEYLTLVAAFDLIREISLSLAPRALRFCVLHRYRVRRTRCSRILKSFLPQPPAPPT